MPMILVWGSWMLWEQEDRHPNLDRLCAEGLKFTNAYSTSAVCTPARFSILTGRYPFRNEQAHILPGDAGCIIKRELDTVPKLFQRAGYHTGIVGKWHLGLGDGDKPIDWNQEINLTPIDLGFENHLFFRQRQTVCPVYS